MKSYPVVPAWLVHGTSWYRQNLGFLVSLVFQSTFTTDPKLRKLLRITAMTASMKFLLIGVLAACASAVRIGARAVQACWALQLHFRLSLDAAHAAGQCSLQPLCHAGDEAYEDQPSGAFWVFANQVACSLLLRSMPQAVLLAVWVGACLAVLFSLLLASHTTASLQD